MMAAPEKKYTTTEREALTMIFAVRKYRYYLLPRKFIFHTDHNPLKYIVNKPDLTGRIARWILLMQEFIYMKWSISQGRQIAMQTTYPG